MQNLVVDRCSFGAGDVIDGRYRVEKLLGEGAFGKVYAVRDASGVTYALKLLKLWEVHPEIRQPLVARFDMEYETGLIDSNHLVHSVGHGIVKGNPYIVMEFCPGGDLVKISQTERLNVAKIAVHVLYGLAALHSHGKVHRDLKPENVLLKANGHYVLTDFGISGDRNKRMTERNIMGKPKQIFGTYAYMPPEQVNPKKDATVLPTTDIFSLGVMLFQLLTGRLPFGNLANEGDLPTYIRNAKEGRWDRKQLQGKDHANEWIRVIDGCLTPDFTKRLQNTNAVLELIPEAHMYSDDRIDESMPSFKTKAVNGLLLRVMQGEEHGRVYKLNAMLNGQRRLLTMGRADYGINNDINLRETASQYVSRRHCTLEFEPRSGAWVIRDGQWNMTAESKWKQSTNGTFINSTEVSPCGEAMQPGDIISVGDIKLRVEGY